jgi:hypothetical protein
LRRRPPHEVGDEARGLGGERATQAIGELRVEGRRERARRRLDDAAPHERPDESPRPRERMRRGRPRDERRHEYERPRRDGARDGEREPRTRVDRDQHRWRLERPDMLDDRARACGNATIDGARIHDLAAPAAMSEEAGRRSPQVRSDPEARQEQDRRGIARALGMDGRDRQQCRVALHDSINTTKKALGICLRAFLRTRIGPALA